MSPTETASKRLSGGARGYLNDLTLLNEKTTQEMARGIAESYLDRDGAIALAAELGVEPPRVKQRFYRYFTETRVYSIPIDAYTSEQADEEAARMQEINVAQSDLHFGNRSRFDADGGRIQRVLSATVDRRPNVVDVSNAHPWEVERSEAVARGETTPRHVLNWNSIITH